VTWRHPPHGEPQLRRVLITTSFDLPGHDVVAVQGEVFGLTVRCRNIGTGYLARLRSIGRGEIRPVTSGVTGSKRQEASIEQT